MHGAQTYYTSAGSPTETHLQDIGYTGRVLDTESNHGYFRSRVYSAAAGVFVSRDNARGYVDGLNLYTGYFAPVGMDPTGEEVIRGNAAEQCPRAYAAYRRCVSKNSTFFVACTGQAQGPTLGVEVVCAASCGIKYKAKGPWFGVCMASCAVYWLAKLPCDWTVCNEILEDRKYKCCNKMNRDCWKESRGRLEPCRQTR